jgi:RNase P/RNase MRP subunit POP5
MVVKEKRGRRRYVAFETACRISDEELLASFTSTFIPKGIKVPNALASKPSNRIAITTLSTSGTLRTLREKYFAVGESR